MTKYDQVRTFQKNQGYDVSALRNPTWGSHRTSTSIAFAETMPGASIWNAAPYYNQAPLYCTVDYTKLGGFNNNIFGMGYGNCGFGNMYGMNQNTWNNYNNAMSSAYKGQTISNKVNNWLTGIYGAGAIIQGFCDVTNGLGNATSDTTSGTIDGLGGVFDGLVEGGKGLLDTVKGWFS